MSTCQAPAQAAAKAVRAPYYQDSAVTLYHGDCRAVMAELESVDVVITDPPYSEHVHAKSRRGVKGGELSESRDFGFASLAPDLRTECASAWASLVKRWVLVFSDVEGCGDWRAQIEGAELQYIRTGAWVKPGTTPQFTGDRPAAGFEVVTIAHPPGKKRWNGGGHAAVWTYPIAHGDRFHPTEKPLPLMTRLVSLFSDPGETILDPFAGSGTTLRAAKDLGRRAIGIELDERHCETAARRLAQEVLL